MLLEMAQWLDSGGLLPHAYCLQLRSELLWLHVVSDAIIFAAYFVIPLTLVYFIRRQRYRLSFSWAIVLFAGFIVLCGTGHLIEIVTMWRPVYYLQGVEKAATALVSIGTAAAIIPLVPRLLAWRSPEELEAMTRRLQAEVSARTAVEADLRSSVAELNRTVRELEQFAYIASHDLQAPLRTIGGFTQLLQRRYRGKLDGEADELIECVVGGCRSMQQVIDGMLALSRIERRAGGLERRSLADALGHVRKMLAGDMERAQATLVVGDMPELLADHGLIAQLFQNLISNAIKFRREGVPPRVEIEAWREPEHVHVVVRDNGIGVPVEHAESIFAMFKRLHAADVYDGAGIGLAICRKIADFHGGRIWAAACDSGAEFHLRLPHDPALVRRQPRVDPNANPLLPGAHWTATAPST